MKAMEKIDDDRVFVNHDENPAPVALQAPEEAKSSVQVVHKIQTAGSSNLLDKYKQA